MGFVPLCMGLVPRGFAPLFVGRCVRGALRFDRVYALTGSSVGGLATRAMVMVCDVVVSRLESRLDREHESDECDHQQLVVIGCSHS